MMNVQVARFGLILAPIVLLALGKVQPSSGILNCLTPNMFKIGKGGGQPNVYGPHSGERANWYPQQYQGQPLVPYGAMAYGQHPMKLLFQPKWRGSLFGPKKWMDWRGMSSSFYRPGFGYVMPYAPLPGGHQLSDQLNLPPAFFNQQVPPSPASNSYSSAQHLNDGWSVPLGPYNQQQQTSYSSYDSYTVSPAPLVTPSKQQTDPYGTKGGSGKQQFSTTKNVLIANGGYSSHDALLMGGGLEHYSTHPLLHHYRPNHPAPAPHHHYYNQNLYLNPSPSRNHSLSGYAYPEWYSGVLDGPVKRAQQLYRLQLRRAGIGGI